MRIGGQVEGRGYAPTYLISPACLIFSPQWHTLRHPLLAVISIILEIQVKYHLYRVAQKNTPDEKLLYLKDHFTFWCKIYRAALALNCAHLHQYIYMYIIHKFMGVQRRRASFWNFLKGNITKNVKILSMVDIDKHNSLMMQNNVFYTKCSDSEVSTTSFNTCS